MCSMFGVDVEYVIYLCVPCRCSMFGVDVVYVFHVCVPCLVLMLSM